jgi:predicted RNA binding protein YcfA (HicA-like mRNA interferase family)
MTRLPRLRGSDLIGVLKRAGFELTRIRGSHHFLRHGDGRTTVVPVHGSEVIGPGLLRKILRDCDMTLDEFHKLR